MAMGPAPMGLLYLAAVKFAGYSLAGHVINSRYNRTSPNPLVFGASRTLIGIVVGVAFASLLFMIPIVSGGLPFLVLLGPVRLAEWLFVLWLFYERKQPTAAGMRTWLKSAVLGSGWSYLLDVPAIVAVFVLPGGAWIC